MTLTEFLLARIAEDEDPALFIQEMDARYPHPPSEYITEWQWVRFTAPVEYPRNRSSTFEPGAPTPARVLAECEAKRRIVEIHQRMEFEAHFTSYTDRGRRDRDWNAPACQECGHPDETPIAYPCPTLRALAIPYADHPDYDPAWHVDTPAEGPGS